MRSMLPSRWRPAAAVLLVFLFLASSVAYLGTSGVGMAPSRSVLGAPVPSSVVDRSGLRANEGGPGSPLDGARGPGAHPFDPAMLDSPTHRNDPSAAAAPSKGRAVGVASANIPEVGVTVGTGPNGAAYDRGKGEIFVANEYSDSVSVIADTNNTVVATIAVGQLPTGVAYDNGTGEVFVTNYGSDTVSVVSDSNDTVVATVTVGHLPFGGIAYDSGKGEIFVSNSGSGNVSVISDTNNTVVATIGVGSPRWRGVRLRNRGGLRREPVLEQRERNLGHEQHGGSDGHGRPRPARRDL
jgi:YVTN family beta-propeller protein